MEITCEGKTYTFPDGMTPLAIWKTLGHAEKEHAVLAEFDGEIMDMRTPIEGSGRLSWIPLASGEGEKARERTLIMLLVAAVRKVCGAARDVHVKHSLFDGLYCEFSDGHTPFGRELDKLEETMREIAASAAPIEPIRVEREEAAEFLERSGRAGDAELVRRNSFKEFHIYQCGALKDYYFGPMLPDMSYAGEFRLVPYAPGFLLRFPDAGETALGEYHEEPLFARVFLEAEEWGRLIGCREVAELNEAIRRGRAGDLVAMAEALQEKRLAALADKISGGRPRIRMVCIAGPSSAGKTTFMHRLLIQLWVNGVKPVMISLDDFYRERTEETKEKANYEDLSALDTELFEACVTGLLEGRAVRLPRFDFKTQTRSWSEEFTLGRDQPVLVEGLHALNPALSRFVPGYQCLHIYLGALTQISINAHNRISTSDTRLLRRMVRDARTRGNDPEKTLALWDTVRRGEEQNIFLFQGRADEIFNTALIYEIPVLKKEARPLLAAIGRESPVYARARRLLTALTPFEELPTSIVPDGSILREFVGGRE